MMLGAVVIATLLSVASSEQPVTETVTGAHVCAVEDAIRGHLPAWSKEYCERLAHAYGLTPWPVTMLAISVIESNLRPNAVSRVLRLSDGRRAKDCGLTGVRCVLGSRGRCLNISFTGSNGMALHPTWRDLLIPEVGILLGAEIVRQKRASCGRRWPDCYNGNPSGNNRYGEQIAVLSSAFFGRLVSGGSARVRDIAKRILRSVFRMDVS